MKKVVCFGDYLLRLNPPGYQKLMQASALETSYTGDAANVCVSLACFGADAAYVTRLPEHELGRCARASLQRFGIDVSHIAAGGERIGILFLEKGASQRPSKVVYDRGGSAFCTASPEDFDWDAILDGAELFHFSGITPALGGRLPEICRQACEVCRRRGITVSFDVNYRSALWTMEQAGAVLRELAPFADILFCGPTDADKMLGVRPDESYLADGALTRNGYENLCRRLCAAYGLRMAAMTLRENLSASDNRLSAMLYTGGRAYFSREYAIHIVDRVGGGDSFAAGLLYTVLSGMEPQLSIEFAAAASCLKHTIESDVNLSTVPEVMRLVQGDASGRVQR